ncbi:unnamed protein product [Rotaria magnacalcarata]|uniref:Uncharacterized protein n=3 Tax=Rotaria magnacalcarata TaxID=392030 RepID=A0A815NXG3_9BILA|nr:unnamed protein product [Rotaria magnacalcarata]CAF1438938.1 unnamed protein product [Rotaria magnacalcarata]CAF4068804.1 unnamed protein product [Rotaria magnacalcarata]
MSVVLKNQNTFDDRQLITQNYVLIWLDPNINESNDDFHHSKTQLQRIVNRIETFIDLDHCIDFLTDMQDEKMLMIVSEAVAQHILSFIHNFDQLYAVYIFRDNKIGDDQLIQKWWKVKGICTQIKSVCEVLPQAIKQFDQNSISVSFIPIDENVSDKNLDQLDPTFMYAQILKEILLETQYNEQSIKDFNIILIHPSGGIQAKIYLYSMLNRALRTLETDAIIKLGFFISDLHKDIEQLHSKQFSVHSSASFTVYRGQGLSKMDFERLIKTNRALYSNRFNPDFIGVLSVININPSISSVPFVRIENFSNFSSENEILFSMHTVFRIGAVRKLDDTNRFWQVELKLTSDDDEQLRILTNRIRIETAGAKSWLRLGVLLMKIGQFNQAEEVYTAVLNQTSDEFAKAAIYNQLGLIKEHQGEYNKAMSFCEKSIEITRNVLSEKDPGLTTMYGNVAIVYGSIGEYAKAISLFEKSLEIRQEVLPSNDPYLATSHINIGMVYYRKGEYANALASYEKAYEIYKIALPPNHPDFALSYNNIASAYQSLGNYSSALRFHKKALDIRLKVLPPNHPDFTASYVNVASVYEAMGDYSQALLFHEKAREIYEKVFSSNHPMLATSYNNIASIYHEIGECRRALLYYEKAHEIFTKIYPSNHFSLATSHNNIANLYHEMNEDSKALLTQKKAHAILEKASPINYPMLATSYNNMAAMYNAMHDYSNALLSHEKALEIRQKNLPPNHPVLATSYNNIGSVYFKIGQYQKALPFFERAFSILKQSVPANHPNLQSIQETIIFLKQK